MTHTPGRARVAVGLLAVLAATSCTTSPPSAPPAPAVVATNTLPCTGPKVVGVADADQLTEALAGASPGAVIKLADGVYPGAFVARTPGTAQAPITLCGGRGAVLDGGPTDGGYALHLDGASHWQVSGFTIRGGQKGLMADAVTADRIEGLLIESTGDEALHLRRNSSDNIVRGNEIRDTGRREVKFGEGIYIGSAESNWCEQTACGPDRSDRNLIEGNTVSGTTAESVDIKEGTTGGILRGNSFSGAGMKDSDSWVDVKGNGWTIADNRGVDAPEDGFQVHEILDGWALDNVFSGNTARVNADGYAVNVTKNKERNRVTCTNVAEAADKGLSNTDCTS